MAEYAYEVYEAIVEATSSELILFFIIFAVFAVPFYVIVLKGRKAAKQHESEREERHLNVITENTRVIAGLKVTLDNNGTAMVKAIERIHSRIDEQTAATARIDAKLDVVSASQTEIASKVNKVLLAVGAPPPPNSGNSAPPGGGDDWEDI